MNPLVSKPLLMSSKLRVGRNKDIYMMKLNHTFINGDEAINLLANFKIDFKRSQMESSCNVVTGATRNAGQTLSLAVVPL